MDDLLSMSKFTQPLHEDIHVVAPLSNNRLLLNNHVIYPNTPCTVRNNSQFIHNCVFMSTMVKEKEVKEKKKEPEVGIRMNCNGVVGGEG